MHAPAQPFPKPEVDGGWLRARPQDVGVDTAALADAVAFHDQHPFFSQRYGSGLVIIYQGRLIAESYVTGHVGGPQPWTAATCNDMKSSTKSAFGTAVGVFLDEFAGHFTLDSLLVGRSRDAALIPQIWDQPLTDRRKTMIKVKHALSMTSGHTTPEPWLAPSARRHHPGYGGAFQMAEYCFGWWGFDGIADQHTLLFEPGTAFNYSNYGLELVALAMRNIAGATVADYLYERVLRKIGFPQAIVANQYGEMPYTDERELNFSAEPGWGRGGSSGCNAYGADGSTSRYGYNTIVGSALRCTARDFARLGLLWLNKGQWKDEQLLSAEWLQQATNRYVREDGSTPANYGYTFWVHDDWDGIPSDTFAARGHNFNNCYVIPSRDLVIVRQGNANGDRSEREAFAHALLRKIVASVVAQ